MLAAIALVLAGCLRDEYAECPVVPGSGKQFALSMNVPTGIVKTRAAVDDEAYIKSLDVVVYKYSGSASDNTAFVQLLQLDAAQIDGSSAYKTFKVNVSDAAADPLDKYCFVLLANVRSEVNLIKSSLDSDTKTQMLAKLKFDVTYNKDWNAVYLPMWGESGMYPLDIQASIPTVQMIRSLARMELKLEGNASTLLTPRIVSIPYQYGEGRVAPLAANYDGFARSVTAPSLFSMSLMNSPVQTYEVPALQVMYTAEYDKPAGKEFCLLLEAKYNNEPAASWYKVALRDKNGLPVDILRNHNYTVTVTDVTGPGHTSAEDALDSNTYMQAEVAEWNDAVQNAVFDGNHYLKVSHPKLDLYKEAGNIGVDITTDFPGSGDMSGNGNNFLPGMTLHNVDNPGDWLRFSFEQASPPDNMAMRLNLDWDEWTGTGSRTASFTVKAGNMKYVIDVNQTDQTWLAVVPDYGSLMDGMFHQVDVQSSIAWTVSAAHDWGDDLSAYFSLKTTDSKQSSDKVIYKTTDRQPYAALGELGAMKLTFVSPEYNYTPKTVRVFLTSRIL